MLHPFISPAHLLALLTLGLLFGQRGVVASRHAMGTLVGAMALGLWLSLRLAHWPEPDVALLALGTVFGLGVALALRWPAWLLPALAALVGLAVGIGSAPDGMAPAQRGAALIGTLIGASLCTACLAGAVHHLTHHRQRPWALIGVRVVASWLSASAILVLALALGRPG